MDPTGEQTVFERLGGLPAFERLVDRFYVGIESDPVLLPLYPEQHDLGPARRRLALFLAQFWGGPQTYSDERGHPMLRMRHMPYAIGPVERDRWLLHMAVAVEETVVDESLRAELMTYFVRAAEHLRNDDRLGLAGSP
jgi:hemoglobin